MMTACPGVEVAQMVPPRDYLRHAVRSAPYPAYHMNQAEVRQAVPVHFRMFAFSYGK